jgi:hypothetical protein
MNRFPPYNERTDRHWLSRLLDDAAFPALSLAVAVSQLNIRDYEKDPPGQFRRQSNQVQLDNGFAENADKNSERAATESSPFKEKAGSEKQFADDQ